jgi:hypothetical protein
VDQFKYLGTNLTNQNSILEEIKSGLKSRNLVINLYRTIILPVVLYGCETWSLTLREGHRLRVFENRVLWRICGPKRDKVMRVGKTT